MLFQISGPDDTIVFPMNPPSISVGNSLQQLSYSVQDLGGISFPSGREPVKFSWEGMFPGPARANFPFVNKPYRFPVDLVTRLDSWFGVVPGQRAIKLELTVTSPHPTDPAPIIKTVFLSGWNWSLTGAYGDYDYQIEFTEWRTLLIPQDTAEQSIPEVEEDTTAGEGRADPGPPNEYMVKGGDTLMRIAAVELGDADRYMEIFEINKDPTIPGFTDPNVISEGWVLRLPGTLQPGP